MAMNMIGIAAAPGLAIGKVMWLRQQSVDVMEQFIEPAYIEKELQRFEAAIMIASQEITELQAVTTKKLGQKEAEIFEAHREFLTDPSYVDEIRSRIHQKHESAAYACQQVTQEMAAMLRGLDNEYLQARATDIHDVGQRLLRHLTESDQEIKTISSDKRIVLAEDLTPSDTVSLPEGIVGIATMRGSVTGHAAILARTLGIPMIVALGEALNAVQENDLMILDGKEGTLCVTPDEAMLLKTRALMEGEKALAKEQKNRAADDAVTKDGQRIHVLANIGSLKDIERAIEFGAEGVGLFRTEFLYLENTDWPSEQQQYDVYRQVLSAFSNRPVVIRTLDIGGDKALPYAPFDHEENPFLGHRAIRFCLANPAIFKTQLRALLRASVHGQLWIMFPMIETLDEIAAAKELVATCRQELEQEGTAVSKDYRIGMMVEIPAAAVMADQFAKQVDFMSIGTNDLTQYTLAADRGNEKVAYLYDAFHPAVLRLIAMTGHAGQQQGIVVGMCGELAGDSLATELLIGMGLTELSMSAASIPAVKDKIRSLTTSEAKAKVPVILDLGTASAIRAQC